MPEVIDKSADMDVDAQHEFTSVRAIRGTEAKTIAKWQGAGWELDSQSPGPLLRTELTFRRVKPKTLGTYLSAFGSRSWGAFRRLRPAVQVALSGGVIMLVVIIGVVAGMQGGRGTPEPAASPTEAAVAPSEQPSQVPTQQPEAVTSHPVSPEPPAEEALTAENNADLAALLTLLDPGAASVEEFAAKYHGRTIEFDGNIANMMHHGDYKTRYDILLGAGDYSETTAAGPNFKFENVNTVFDLHLTGTNIPDTIGTGDNLHIVARVGEYNSTQELFFLEPISTEFR